MSKREEKKHLLPWFSSYNICSISTESIQQFTAEKLQAGLSPRTVKSLLILLQTILKYGEAQEYFSIKNNLQVHFPKTTANIFRAMDDYPAYPNTYMFFNTKKLQRSFFCIIISLLL